MVSASGWAPFYSPSEFVLSALSCVPFEQPFGEVTLLLRKGDIFLMTAGGQKG